MDEIGKLSLDRGRNPPHTHVVVVGLVRATKFKILQKFLKLLETRRSVDPALQPESLSQHRRYHLVVARHRLLGHKLAGTIGAEVVSERVRSIGISLGARHPYHHEGPLLWLFRIDEVVTFLELLHERVTLPSMPPFPPRRALLRPHAILAAF